VRVTHLELTDFRNYERLEVDLGPGVTTFVGANGQGKTNIVEAVAYLATFSSHRTATDTALVRAGSPQAIVRSLVDHGDRAVGLDIQINPGRANRWQVNRTPVKRSRDALGIVRAVMFAPEDLALVKGDPSSRRRYLDSLVVQLSPRHAAVIADYEKTLRQRNSLLRGAAKSTGPGEREAVRSTLDVWDDRLVEFGADLAAARVEVVERIREPVASAYASVAAARNHVELAYSSSRLEAGAVSREQIETAMREALARVRSEESARGVTLVGPHRDELEIVLNELPARGYASHGESWSLALALRLGSYSALTEPGAGPPVLILDDVFAELDQSRRTHLAQVASAGEGQVLVTAAVSDDVPEQLLGVRFCVEGGSVREQG
jgi:DNA replication and repair protein RecF